MYCSFPQFTVQGVMVLIAAVFCFITAFTAWQWKPLDMDDKGESPCIAYWPSKALWWVSSPVVMLGVVSGTLLLVMEGGTYHESERTTKFKAFVAFMVASIVVGVLSMVTSSMFYRMLDWNSDGFDEVDEAEREDYDSDAEGAAAWVGQQKKWEVLE
jgi:hypothetical protein